MQLDSSGLVHSQLIIDGQWTPSVGGDRFEVNNPAQPNEIVGDAARANKTDVDRAVQAAHRAFPAWSALSYQERADQLAKIASNVVLAEDEMVARTRNFTREHGKVLKESGMELTRLGDRFSVSAAYADRLAQDEHLSGPPFDTLITRQPRGVALLIVPWNWPLSILGAKLPQALMAGNSVVIYIPAETPLIPALTIQKMAEALPPGVINLITGLPNEVGDALVTHPLVRKIDFTGGVATGRHIMSMAAQNLTPVTLELGGNDPAIVLEDAELDEAALQRMVVGTFITSGQVCMCLKRAYIHRSRYREVCEAFHEIAGKMVVGDGLDPEVTMGPLNNLKQLMFVKELVTEAQQSGARVTEVGRVTDEGLFNTGYFHRPTLVENPDPGLRVVQQEQFGPVIPLLPFDKEEDAIRMANDSEFGLCSSVWTVDRERALNIARQLEAGYTYLNAHGPMSQDARAPFGGFKNSGIGRELGYQGILEFQEYHSITGPTGWLY